MHFSRQNKPLAEFNFSSLTDIVMLLLIFFLITSQFVVQTGVKVKLPGSDNDEQVIPSKLIVSIMRDGALFLGQDAVSLDDLPARLTILKGTETDPNLIIRADKEASIDLVIKVIDAARDAEIDKFTIETEKKNI